MLSDEEVLAALRLALRQLYETPALRANPLVGLLGLADAPNAASELRRILTETIHSLRPGGAVPAESEAWRVYEILEYRYLQQSNQAQVAKQLGLSIRHLRREEQRAAEVLAHSLRARLASATPAAPPAKTPPEAADLAGAIGDELAWLDQENAQESVDLGGVLRGALALARPLAEARQVALEIDAPDAAWQLSTHSVALRQLILCLLTTALCQAEGHSVSVRASVRNHEAIIEIGTPGASSAGQDEARRVDALAMAQRLSRPCRARLEVRADEIAFFATIALPLSQQTAVLVIDDNQDTLRLLQRYVNETAFRIIGAQNLSQALTLAAQESPEIIVLDVMMPQVDGWEVLGHLRQHPLTRHAPVVVCSILTQDELALSLGASDYIRKPVSQTAFLQALERQLRREEPEPPPRPRRSAETLAG
jgi:CheY-like chemotaxis protein